MSEIDSEKMLTLDDLKSEDFVKARRGRPQVRKRKVFKVSSVGRYLFYGLPVVAFVLIISIFVVSIASVKPVEVPFQDFRGHEVNLGGQIDRDAPPVLSDHGRSDVPNTTPQDDDQDDDQHEDQEDQDKEFIPPEVEQPSSTAPTPAVVLMSSDATKPTTTEPIATKAKTTTTLETKKTTSPTTAKPTAAASNLPVKGSTQYVLNRQVYVREGPGKEHPIAGFGLRGMSLRVLEPGKEWSKIRTENSLEGYMLNELFGPVQPENIVEEIGTGRYMYIDTGAANLREEPTTDSEIITVAYKDEKVYQISTNGGWSRIKTEGGIEAYIRNDLIRETPPIIPFVKTNRVVYVDTNVANVRESATTDSAVVVQIRRDQRLTELKTNGTWSEIKLSDGTTGYVHGELLTTLEPAPSGFKKVEKTVYVNTGYANIRSKPNTNSSILNVASFGTPLKQLAFGSGWTFVEYSEGNRGYISTDLILGSKPKPTKPTTTTTAKPTTKGKSTKKTAKPTSTKDVPAPTNPPQATTKGKQVVQVANSLIGTPYVLGGCSTRSIDCSGLVKYAYNAVGFRMTFHGATGQAQLYGRKVPFNGRDFSPLLPGDLIFFSRGKGYHHVGIYIGNNQMVHATSRRGVHISDLMRYSQTPALVKRIFE